jgi:hypothetical protein
MLFNLYPIVEKDLNEVAEAFLPEWSREEFGFLVYKGGNRFAKNNCLTMTLSPSLLTFRKEFGQSSTYEIWIECSLIIGPKENSENSAKFMIEEFNRLLYKPFKDEDAYYSYFKRVDQHNSKNSALSFFINPDYPSGWWCNHTL